MELNLSYSGIDKFDAKRIENISNEYPSLERLILNYNSISYIPREISQLKGLKHLHLKNNNITALPKELFYLKSLKELYLSNNYLTAIPSQIKNLKNLRHLNLRYNELTLFPREFAKLTNLTSLILPHNLIEEIPDFFNEMDKLKYINIGYNPLKKIPDELLDSNTVTILYTSKIQNSSQREKIYFKPSIELRPVFEKYLQKIQEFVEKNYKNSELTIEEINKVNKVEIQGENFQEIANNFEQFINIFFEKELLEKNEETKYKIVKNLIVKQITENKLDKGLTILGAYLAEIGSNTKFNEVVILKGELTRIKSYERIGTMSFEEGLRQKRLISKKILDITDEIQ